MRKSLPCFGSELIALLIVLLLIGLGYFTMTWEKPSYRRVFESIKPGMSISVVERRFRQLDPDHKRISGPMPSGAALQVSMPTRPGQGEKAILIKAPISWRYAVLFDEKGRITDKTRYWE